MIRLIQEEDFEAACKIVNDCWKSVYSSYVNKELLTNKGCLERSKNMKRDFLSGRLSNYVYEENGQPVALLSIGDTEDSDKKGAFELWRIYIDKDYRNLGIGSKLLNFTEKNACESGYKEMVIWAFKENYNAISFYNKHGYVQDKERYLNHPYCAYGVRFNKKLSIGNN